MILDDAPFKKKGVEAWLNEVNYEALDYYIPTDFALNFTNFIKLVNGAEGEQNKTPPVHLKVMDSFISKKDRIANMMHRGFAKTTLIEYLFLYLGVYHELPDFGKVYLAIYVSDSMDNGVKNMRKNLEYRWENSEFLQQMLPPNMGTKFTDSRWEFVNADGERFIVKGYGAKTGVRGTKELGRRPQIAVMDDLLSDDDARSPTVMATIKDTVYKAIDYAMDPNGYKIIWNGTPFNANDPLYEAVEDGTWEVNVYPVCEKFPCEEHEFRGSWEDRFPYQYVKTKYDQAIASGKIASFNQELMLRIMSEEDRLIKDSDMRWYSLRTLMANLSSFNRYITTDFATSAKQSADFNFLTVWGINSIGDWYWIAGVCKKQTMDRTIDDLFNLVSKFEPQEVGIEVSGQQGGFIPWIMDQMMTRNIWFPLTSSNNSGSPGIKPTTDKMQRFQVAVPMFKQGKVYFPKEALEARDPALLELLNELSLVSSAGFKSKNDDGLDNVSQLPLMRLTKPSATVTNTIGSGGLWEDMAPATTAGGLDSYIV